MTSWEPGDLAWLTVPSRDSAGYSKRNIGSLTIPVIVTAGSAGDNIQIIPEGGVGTARVKADRLVPRSDDPLPLSKPSNDINNILYRVSLAMLSEGVSEAMVREVMATVDEYIDTHYEEAH